MTTPHSKPPKPRKRADLTAIGKACERLRERYDDLYKLPYERFRSLIAPAVRLGIERGDFHDYGTFTEPPQEPQEKVNDEPVELLL